ncbi:MAG TPA: hypothetical protein VKS21_00685 [Spirochaetota bacterium]|nr:hypothetical protein [Spirochaetota bacterium]
MKRKLLLTSLLVTIVCLFSEDYIYRATFLQSVNINARAAGMGGAYAALANGAAGLYWNPGATAFGSDIDLIMAYSHLGRMAGVNDFYFSGVRHSLVEMINLTIGYGFSMQYFGEAGFFSEKKIKLNTGARMPIPLGVTDFLEVGLGLNLSIMGLDARTEYEFKTRTISLDIGAKAYYKNIKVLKGAFALGLNIKNLIPSSYSLYTEDVKVKLTPEIITSLAYEAKYLTAAAGVKFINTFERLCLGLEGKYKGLALRYGFIIKAPAYNAASAYTYEPDSGVSFSSLANSFGIGFQTGPHFNVDLAYSAGFSQFSYGTLSGSMQAHF